MQKKLGLLEQQMSLSIAMEFLSLRPANFSSNRNAVLHSRSLGPRAGVSNCGTRFETPLRGPTQCCVEIVKGVHQGMMIEIGDFKKARP